MKEVSETLLDDVATAVERVLLNLAPMGSVSVQRQMGPPSWVRFRVKRIPKGVLESAAEFVNERLPVLMPLAGRWKAFVKGNELTVYLTRWDDYTYPWFVYGEAVLVPKEVNA